MSKELKIYKNIIFTAIVFSAMIWFFLFSYYVITKNHFLDNAIVKKIDEFLGLGLVFFLLLMSINFLFKYIYGNVRDSYFFKIFSVFYKMIYQVLPSNFYVEDENSSSFVKNDPVEVKPELAVEKSKDETLFNFKIADDQNVIFSYFYDTRVRIYEEIKALERRGVVNLIIGIVTTGVAVGILVYAMFDLTKTTLADVKLIMVREIGPRVLLSLLIEFFSFFFLRLYVSSLAGIRYFQNELTNVDMKMISLRSAIDTKKENVIKDVINGLAATERNFVLQKDQSTVGLEKAKLESTAFKDALEALSKVIGNRGK